MLKTEALTVIIRETPTAIVSNVVTSRRIVANSVAVLAEIPIRSPQKNTYFYYQFFYLLGQSIQK